jgi:peptidoglycan hydrolase CwlO-like protein
MKKVKEVANKISEEQLTKVRDQQQKLNEALRTLGVLDVQKQNLRNQIEEVSKEIEETKAELEKEYGQVNINLEDGTYSEIEKEDAE